MKKHYKTLGLEDGASQEELTMKKLIVIAAFFCNYFVSG